MTGTEVAVERAETFAGTDLDDLCDATEAAIADGGGFGWVKAPPRHVLEAYWKGVVLVPDRQLFLGRLDRTVAGAAQLMRPPRNNEAQAHRAQLTGAFVAPWARGHGLARQLTLAVEEAARAAGFKVLSLSVRETQGAALALYRSLGYEQWATDPRYAWIDGRFVAGLHFSKLL